LRTGAGRCGAIGLIGVPAFVDDHAVTGVLGEDVVLDRGAVGIHFDATGQAGLVADAVGVADSVGFDELHHQLVGGVTARQIGQQGEGVAVFEGGAEGKVLQAVEVLRAAGIALGGLAKHLEFTLYGRLPGGGLLHGPAKGLPINA